LKLAQKTISEMTSTGDVNEKQIKELNDKLRDLSESDSKIAENHRYFNIHVNDFIVLCAMMILLCQE